jgi:hypothetical protein
MRTDIQTERERDWYDGSNGRFSWMRSLVKYTRQSVETFKQPWDLNSPDVFRFYDGLLLSGNAVQVAVVLSMCQASAAIKFSWNVMAHGEAREEKWRGNKKMEWVTSKRHMTAEHRLVRAVQTLQVDVHSSPASRLNWRPRFKWTRPFHRKTKSGFCACANAFQTQSTIEYFTLLGCYEACVGICSLKFWYDMYRT